MRFGKIRPQGSVSASWELVEETTLGTAATSYTFSSLTGNTAEVYRLICYCVNNGGSGNQVYALLNNDSTSSNYGRQLLQGVNTTISAVRSTTQPGMRVANSDTAGYVSFSDTLLYADSGDGRTALSLRLEDSTGTTATDINFSGFVWNNTGSEITSIVIQSDLSNGLGVDTYLALYKKVA